jgi:hypothetical protein
MVTPSAAQLADAVIPHISIVEKKQVVSVVLAGIKCLSIVNLL